MEILLQYMYGAIVDLPSGASARYSVWMNWVSRIKRQFLKSKLRCILCLLSHSQVVLAADMLGLEGMKDVVEMVLIRDYCRFFPKVSCAKESIKEWILLAFYLPMCTALYLSFCWTVKLGDTEHLSRSNSFSSFYKSVRWNLRMLCCSFLWPCDHSLHV